jgi:hypothetical protein
MTCLFLNNRFLIVDSITSSEGIPHEVEKVDCGITANGIQFKITGAGLVWHLNYVLQKMQDVAIDINQRTFQLHMESPDKNTACIVLLWDSATTQWIPYESIVGSANLIFVRLNQYGLERAPLNAGSYRDSCVAAFKLITTWYDYSQYSPPDMAALITILIGEELGHWSVQPLTSFEGYIMEPNYNVINKLKDGFDELIARF